MDDAAIIDEEGAILELVDEKAGAVAVGVDNLGGIAGESLIGCNLGDDH